MSAFYASYRRHRVPEGDPLLRYAFRLARELAALACLFSAAVHAVDPHRFMPFDEAPFGPYRAQVCDKFLDHDERIRFLAPALSGDGLARLLAPCPGLLDIDERVKVEPSAIALYEADIDNDGSRDQVLYVHNLYRHLPSESYFKLDLAHCRLTRLFGAARSNHLFTLEDRTYIESVQRCKGPLKILGALRYLNCTLIYEVKGSELRPFRDELCAYIDRAWSRR
jgi:hypothetical protein